MKNIAILDTSVASLNKGDEIIMESGRKVLEEITKDNFTVTVPTHTPAFQWFQTNKFSSLYRYLMTADYKFICGTNLLYTNMFRPWPNWNINLLNSKPLKDTILVGVGSGVNSKNINIYTRTLYNKVLSKKYIHSTRDEKTKLLLEELGFKAINTGCITLWDLTPELCEQIPTEKLDKVVFTLTDYAKDKKKDQKLINILIKNYKQVYFWPQGSNDYNYFMSFNNIDSIKILPPTVKDYSLFLTEENCDYVGTRLHGGIFAMKHKRRAVIISVDYRARQMSETYDLNTIDRDDIENLEGYINSKIITDVKVDFNKINDWYKQFK